MSKKTNQGIVMYGGNIQADQIAVGPGATARKSRAEEVSRSCDPVRRAAVFLSYRRNDSADIVGRIYDRLSEAFGEDNVFRDVDSIPVGADFEQALEAALERSDVLAVVIGPGWLGAKDEYGHHRLDRHDDLVRMEVEKGLNREGCQVIPVLVGGASFPSRELLPEVLQPLSALQGVRVRPDPDFERDMERLLRGVANSGSLSSA